MSSQEEQDWSWLRSPSPPTSEGSVRWSPLPHEWRWAKVFEARTLVDLIDDYEAIKQRTPEQDSELRFLINEARDLAAMYGWKQSDAGIWHHPNLSRVEADRRTTRLRTVLWIEARIIERAR